MPHVFSLNSFHQVLGRQFLWKINFFVLWNHLKWIVKVKTKTFTKNQFTSKKRFFLLLKLKPNHTVVILPNEVETFFFASVSFCKLHSSIWSVNKWNACFAVKCLFSIREMFRANNNSHLCDARKLSWMRIQSCEVNKKGLLICLKILKQML